MLLYTFLHLHHTHQIQVMRLIYLQPKVLFVCLKRFLRPCRVPKLWGGGFPTLDSGYSSPRLRVPNVQYLRQTTRYECQWQEAMVYTDYYTTYTNTTDNKLRTDKRYTYLAILGTFSYIHWDMSNIFIPWQNTLKNLSLPGSVRLYYRAWTWHVYPPLLKVSQDFKSAGLKQRSWYWNISKYLIKPLIPRCYITCCICNCVCKWCNWWRLEGDKKQ